MFFVIFAPFFFANPACALAKPVATAGVMDLRDWDFKKQGAIKLEGQWEFFWNQWIDPGLDLQKDSTFIKVPISWNRHVVNGKPISGKGYATYRLRLLLPKTTGSFSIYIPEAGTAYTLYIDGVKYKTIGKPGKEEDTAQPRVESMVVSFQPQQEETRIVIHISNYHHWYGGLWEAIRFGPTESIHAAKLNKIALEYFVFGAILIMGIYHLGLFFIRRKDFTALFFSGFCILMALRVFVMGEWLINPLLPWQSVTLLYKLEYLTYYLGFGTIFLYLHSLYPKDFHEPIYKASLALIFGFSLVVVFSPLYVFTFSLRGFQILSMGLIAYLSYVLWLAVKKKRMGIITFLMGFFIFAVSVVNDLLHAMTIINTLYLFHVGMFIFILFQAYILSHRFSLAFQIIEEQKADLSLKNITLDQELIKRREAQEAVKNSEKKYRRLSELLPSAVFEADKTGKILFCNKAAKIFSNWDISSASRTYYLTDGISPSAKPEFSSFYRKALNSGAIIEFETIGQRENKKEFPAIMFLSNITGEYGNPTGVRGIAIDLSQQKELEKRVSNAEKMEALGTLAGGIAHDFNNILSIIIGYSELAMLDIPKNTALNEKMEIILKAGIRAKELVKQVLSYSRREQIIPRPIQIEETLKSAVKMIHATISSKISIIEEYGTGIFTVKADPNQIHQVILNLAKNAADAMMPEGGTLKIALENINISSFSNGFPEDLEKGNYVMITFSDTGAGIETHLLDKIFDPFFTTKEVGDGTGMGLSVVQGIVTQSKGTVQVVSHVGEGTAFIIYLPAFEGLTEAEVDELFGTVQKGFGHILFVDDEGDIVSLNKNILTQMGYSVDAFTSSIKAFSHLKDHLDEFDLVITDMDMPQMNGAELTAKIRKINSELPIIMCTGFSDQIDEKTAAQIGVTQFLMKPVTRQRISRVVNEILSER
ncbi:MAG: response regulator [Desulfobacteraceae bacterium]|nr:response regulator [Desulfobacteraceae bacterium]